MYQRQVSSSAREVPAIISVSEGPGASARRIRLSIGGATAPPVLAAVDRVLIRLVSSPLRIQSVAPIARPLSKTEDMLEDGPATANGQHSRPGRGRVAAQRQLGVGEALPDAGAAAGRGEDRAALGGVAAGRRSSTRRSSGRRPRSAAGSSRSCPASQRDLVRGPAQTHRQFGVQSGDVDVGEVAGGRPGPRRAGVVGALGVDLDLAGRLDVPQPDPGRGAEVGRAQVVRGEAEQQLVGAAGPLEGRAQPGRRGGRRPRSRSRPGRRPSRAPTAPGPG